jgi:DNA-directed RNA polymerase subunit F
MLDEVRIEAEPLVIETPDADTIAEYSEESSLVFLPCRIRADKVVDPFGGSLDSLVFLLPLVAVVLAVEDIELDAEPEKGKAADIAAALDAVQAARKTADKAAKEAVEAHEIAEKAKTKIKDLAPGTDEEIKTNLEKESQETQYDAALAADRAKEAEAKARLACEEAEASGILPPDDKTESA